MKQHAEEMLNEFLRSEEFKERSEMSEDEIDEISLNKDAKNPLANAVRTLVKEFVKDRDNSSKIVKSINMEINRMASQESS